MFAERQEIHSFVSKFMQLTCEGAFASLSFKSDEGNVTASLTATLRSLSSNSWPMSPSSNHVKPSKLRRRKRRRELRKTQFSRNVADDENEVLPRNEYPNAHNIPEELILDDSTEPTHNSEDYDTPVMMSSSVSSETLPHMPTSSSPCTHAAAVIQNLRNELEAIATKIETIGANVTALYCQVQDHGEKINNINSDAEITDENMARLGCRITHIENYLKDGRNSLT